jgi:hypothetical protein
LTPIGVNRRGNAAPLSDQLRPLTIPKKVIRQSAIRTVGISACAFVAPSRRDRPHLLRNPFIQLFGGDDQTLQTSDILHQVG